MLFIHWTQSCTVYLFCHAFLFKELGEFEPLGFEDKPISFIGRLRIVGSLGLRMTDRFHTDRCSDVFFAEFGGMKLFFFVRLFLRPTIRHFYSLFKVRQVVIGCINHDIVVGLCSELFMRLSYYKMESTAGIEPTPVWFSEQNASTLPTTPQTLAPGQENNQEVSWPVLMLKNPQVRRIFKMACEI